MTTLCYRVDRGATDFVNGGRVTWLRVSCRPSIRPGLPRQAPLQVDGAHEPPVLPHVDILALHSGAEHWEKFWKLWQPRHRGKPALRTSEKGGRVRRPWVPLQLNYRERTLSLLPSAGGGKNECVLGPVAQKRFLDPVLDAVFLDDERRAARMSGLQLEQPVPMGIVCFPSRSQDFDKLSLKWRSSDYTQNARHKYCS